MPLILNPSVPANNVKELVTLAKSKPGDLTMASFGIGSVPHLAGELFNIVAGTKMLHVPYKGGAQALNDVIGGHVSLMFNSVGAVAGPIASGKVKLIAIGAGKRSPGMPQTPDRQGVGPSGLRGIHLDRPLWAGQSAEAHRRSHLERNGRDLEAAGRAGSARQDGHGRQQRHAGGTRAVAGA